MKQLLRADHVAAVVPRLAASIEKYCWLQAQLPSRNVSIDREYQRRFGGFYRVRRGATWRQTFFAPLEAHKATGLSFSEALRDLTKATGRIEASLASKLVATIDPYQPIIDSIVLRNLGLRLPSGRSPDRLATILEVHRQLTECYRTMLESEEGQSADALSYSVRGREHHRY